MRLSTVLAWAAAAGIVYLACAPALRTRERFSPPTPPDSVSADQWRADIVHLFLELDKRHPDLYRTTSRDAHMAHRQALLDTIGDLDYPHALVKLAALVAELGDAHTGLILSSALVHYYPLDLAWLDDGVLVTAGAQACTAAVGMRLAAIDGVPVDTVLARLAPLVPRENSYRIRASAPWLGTMAEALYGLDISQRPDTISLLLLDSSGTTLTLRTGSVPARTRQRLSMTALDAGGATTPPLAESDRSNYWFRSLPDRRALYFQYNRCIEMPDRPFAAFVDQMFDTLQATAAQCLIVDLRNNQGGNSALFRKQFLATLRARRSAAQPRVVGIIDEATFSSGVWAGVQLRTQASATLVGRPTSGSPNHFGEARQLQLPHTRLVVTYSTRYFRLLDSDATTLLPDSTIRLTTADLLVARDLFLEKALQTCGCSAATPDSLN